jgi:flotillin
MQVGPHRAGPLQLEADVIQPAEAKLPAARPKQNAKGDAAKIVEQGRATAQVLTDLAECNGSETAVGREGTCC